MSAIVEIRQRIQETNSLITEYERAAVRPNAPSSLSVNIRSLEKLRDQLERDFHAIARDEGLDVCSYKLLSDTRPTLAAVTRSWGSFQDLFSSVYDALKNGPKRKGRIGKREILATQFTFDFTFEGSVGVSLTLPVHDEDAELNAAIAVLFEVAKARDTETVAAFIERLGIPPIVRLKRWVKAHTDFLSGATVEWRPRGGQPTGLAVQYQELRVLQDAIEKVSEPRIEEQIMPGLLTGASMKRHRFEMQLDDGREIGGTFSDAIGQEHTVTLPKHYQAVIRKTTQIKEATEEEEISYFLVRLGRQLRQ